MKFNNENLINPLLKVSAFGIRFLTGLIFASYFSASSYNEFVLLSITIVFLSYFFTGEMHINLTRELRKTNKINIFRAYTSSTISVYFLFSIAIFLINLIFGFFDTKLVLLVSSEMILAELIRAHLSFGSPIFSSSILILKYLCPLALTYLSEINLESYLFSWLKSNIAIIAILLIYIRPPIKINPSFINKSILVGKAYFLPNNIMRSFFILDKIFLSFILASDNLAQFLLISSISSFVILLFESSFLSIQARMLFRNEYDEHSFIKHGVYLALILTFLNAVFAILIFTYVIKNILFNPLYLSIILTQNCLYCISLLYHSINNRNEKDQININVTYLALIIILMSSSLSFYLSSVYIFFIGVILSYLSLFLKNEKAYRLFFKPNTK